MWTTLTDKKVKIKKPHRCIMCGTKSDPPATMRYISASDGGEFSSHYTCEICDEFMTPQRWRDCDGEISEGDIWQHDEYEKFRLNKQH